MVPQTLAVIRARRRLSTMADQRMRFQHAEGFRLLVVLLCALYFIATCGVCSVKGVQNPVEYDPYVSYTGNDKTDFEDVVDGDVNSRQTHENSIAKRSLEKVCVSSHLFCFPSTLPGFLSEGLSATTSGLQEVSGVQFSAKLPEKSCQDGSNSSCTSICGSLKLASGRTISCYLNFQEDVQVTPSRQANSGDQNDVSSCWGPLVYQNVPRTDPKENNKSVIFGFQDGYSSPNVEVNPPLLDWGQRSLYLPSLAFLTVANTHGDRILNVYEPYSASSQFYPCNFSAMMLGPGEVASICFMFLPMQLGLSSAHLILQTSSGGFLIKARGFAVESPYAIEPLIGLDIRSTGRLNKILSLFNPSDGTLYVEEVTAWILFSSGNASHYSQATCSFNKIHCSADPLMLNVEDWLGIDSEKFGLPITAIRPYRNWEIGPQSRATILELDFSWHSRGKIFGALCLRLLRSSEGKVDTVIVPLEAELGGKSAYDDPRSSVSLSLEVLLPCESSGTLVVSLSLRNVAPYLLKVVKICGVGESSKQFQIKYMEGLILFPGAITHAALVTYTPMAVQAYDSLEIPDVNMNCKLLISINDSNHPQVEIPCSDIVGIYSKHRLDSYARNEHSSEKIECGSSARMGSLGSRTQSPSVIKVLEMVEAEELVLGNWKTQGTVRGISLLEDHELLFPMVQIGTLCSKWIRVKNPSQEPVMMQLILNSGEIIDQCRGLDGGLQPLSSSNLFHNDYISSTRHGFSIAENAITEAYVHPHGEASLGPIIFHPSNPCTWKSSALIRNNLSGVEWLSLQGFGGSVSLVLLEGSEPIESIEFKFNSPITLNFSPPDMLHHVEDHSRACFQPLLKELYAKNMGDLPLEIRRIEVSGTKCASDGFLVHSCEGFFLEPGESTMLLISYQTDFSAAMVHRDLELALAAGMIVMPMTASIPMHIVDFCRDLLFWRRIKESAVSLLLGTSIIFLVLCCIFPLLMAFAPQDFLPKSEKSSIITVENAGKSSSVHCSRENMQFDMSTKINGFSKSINGEEELLMAESFGKLDRHCLTVEQGIAVNSTQEFQSQTNCLPGAENGTEPPFPSKSVGFESSDIRETSQPGNLRVKVGKEKGRRRRKKKVSGMGLTAQLEVSSSQSGNSTPSSPLSPVVSFTPTRLCSLSSGVNYSNEAKVVPAQMVDQHCEKDSATLAASKQVTFEPLVPNPEMPSEPIKKCMKPLLLPSITFPSAGRPSPILSSPSPFLASTSTIAPHARAPGSKLYSQTTDKAEENMTYDDEFKYDIWGDHLFGLHLKGRAKTKKIPFVSPSSTESNSNSFFLSGPQTLGTNSQPKYTRPGRKKWCRCCMCCGNSQQFEEVRNGVLCMWKVVWSSSLIFGPLLTAKDCDLSSIWDNPQPCLASYDDRKQKTRNYVGSPPNTSLQSKTSQALQGDPQTVHLGSFYQ